MNYKPRILGLVFRFVFVLSWYTVHCSEYTRQALENTTVVSEIWRNNGRISLAFVFDRTGSMYDDLVQVRAGATRIFNSTIKNSTSPVHNYILVPFRDPDVGPALKTEDPAKFLKALNDIYVRGGKDCPEMSVTAIKLALELSLPGSVVYVFTDAEAKDHRMLPEVIRLIKQKNIRVNFILTGNCGLEKKFKDKNTYEKIAILSSGQIVNLNKSEVEKIWEFVKISINPNRKNIYSVDKFSRGERTYIVKIDPNIKEVIITVSGEDVEVIIRDSSGELVSLKDENVDVLLNLNSVVSVLIRNPKAGNWSITVRSNGRQTLRVEAISDRWEEVKVNHTVVVIPEVNECARAIHDCDSEEKCLDLPYGFTCVKKCSQGFEMTREGVCIDVDECVRHEGICRDRRCLNSRGSYRCEKICPKGFEGRGNECRDIDECSQNPSICGSQECINIKGSYRCQGKCSRGFTRDEHGVCKDRDECSKYTSICGSKDCFNTQGSYRCLKKCSSGFTRDGHGDCKDVNDCSKNPFICGIQECFNIPGSYRCQKKCLRGFTRDPDGSCKDANECSKNPSICGIQKCINIPGSYRCQEKCLRGFTRNLNGSCTDANECSKNPSICGNQECINIPGSYRCQEKCLRGFTRDLNGSCTDVNECSQYPTICGNQECINIPGSYRCQKKCLQGFTRDENGHCKDINECSQYPTVCGEQDCFNIQGSYRCQEKCSSGLIRDENGYCIDVNECLEQPQRCEHMCENTVGGFQCLCPRATRLANDGITCLRISACPLRRYGRCQYQCNTETGRCECPSGYRLHWDDVSCIDINECLTGQQVCGTRECFNTLGKYHCLNVSCPQGYYPTTDGYCTMQCFYQANQCPAQYTKLQHTSISIPRYLPVNTDFLQLQPYLPPGSSCYCATYFYPVQDSNHLFGVYQIGQVGILYNRVVFDEPGFYEFKLVSDFLNGYGNIVSRTTFQVFVDVADYMF